MGFDLGSLAGLVGKLEPGDIIRHLPRTGNPIIDAGARIGLEALLKRNKAVTETLEGDLDPYTAGQLLFEQMRATPHGVYTIAGPKGSGKSSLSLRIAQELGRRTFIINAPKTLGWITQLDAKDISKLPSNSVVIIDDAGLVYGSRDYSATIVESLTELLTLARHEKITVIANTGVTSTIVKYLLDADVMFLKRPGPMSMIAERQGMGAFLRVSEEAFCRLNVDPETERGYVYALSNIFRVKGIIAYKMPDGYTDQISRNKSGGA